MQIRSRSRKSRARMVVRVGFGLQEWQFADLSVCWSAARCAGVAVWRLIHVPWEDSASKETAKEFFLCPYERESAKEVILLICLYAAVGLGVRERHSKERRDAVMRFSLQKWHSGIVSQCCTCPYAVCVSGCISSGRISSGCVTGKREPRVRSLTPHSISIAD